MKLTMKLTMKRIFTLFSQPHILRIDEEERDEKVLW